MPESRRVVVCQYEIEVAALSRGRPSYKWVVRYGVADAETHEILHQVDAKRTNVAHAEAVRRGHTVVPTPYPPVGRWAYHNATFSFDAVTS